MNTNNSVSGGTVTGLVQAGVLNGGVQVFESPRLPVPHNLPPTTAHFVGRSDHLDRLTRLAGASGGSRICVVDGAPGVGKTTFAVRWGGSVRDLFPDGQVYVDLHGFDPRRPAVEAGAAVRMVLDALHVPARSIPPDPDGRGAYLRSVVDGRDLLLILDNVRDSEQVSPLLPGSPQCFTVVTARHRLDGLMIHHGAERLTLGPLAEPEAADLLTRYVGRDKVDAARSAVATAIAACAGHPLALSVVAARAAADPDLPLQAIVDELQDRHTGLDALRLTDAVDFRAVFELSYEHLSRPLAAAFRDLAVHKGTAIDVRAAAAVTAHDLPGARRVLDELVRRHLVDRVGGGRHALHGLTHVYGAEKSRTTDGTAHRDGAVRAWLNHQLHAAASADRLINPHRRAIPLEPCARPELLPSIADRAAALRWFAEEYDNVLAAIATATEVDLHPYTWQLAWVMSNFAYTGARWQDWISTHLDAVDAVRREGDRHVEVRLRQSLARAYCENGDYERSTAQFRAALDILDRLDDPPGRANAINGLSGVELRSGAFDKALDTALHALSLYAALDDDAGTASTYSLLGRASLAMGRLEEADRYHGLAHALYLRSGNSYGLAHVADCRAELALASGQVDRAALLLREAAEAHFTVGNRHHAARSCRKFTTLLGLPAPVALDRVIASLEADRVPTAREFTSLLDEVFGSSLNLSRDEPPAQP
ncbi:tetratricopeptide repeat protein [Saccharothrix variisporea]|uniref:tetratricopeptide repeat protein n=1 Tax=Saccharothrix variisporea TaxID=543527 RepID=UPI001476F079|nr:tetratricopeptide repeat protein [Saccharothrix variisporea]